jgi:meso-butanediol dehydrogenase / (S,S)-butanediol dehydrogenase / diacetyl reductase
MRFKNKVVLISAAAAGIGAATVRRFLDEGAQVCMSDINAKAMQAMVEQIGDTGGRLLSAICDASDEDGVRALVEQAKAHFGHLDILVNNAGFSIRGRADELPTSDWKKVQSVVLDAVFYGSKAALPHLVESGGCIVNTASISGLFADYNFTAYAAAKGGVVNLTRAMAIDFAREGVRVNAVCPGLVDTNLTRALLANEETASMLKSRIPMRRAAEPAEIAAAIAFLASPEASYITGVCLPVDGGTTAATGQPDFAELGQMLAAGASPLRTT